MIRRIRRLANTFRFIDELTVLNDSGEFERSFREIPSGLKLKEDNDVDIIGSFLDLAIKKIDNKFFVSLYANEMIFLFLLLECLIYEIIFLLTYFTLFLEEKLARTTSSSNEFTTSSRALLNHLRLNIAHNQGGNNMAFKRTPSKYFGLHFQMFQKLNNTSITFKSSLFD